MSELAYADRGRTRRILLGFVAILLFAGLTGLTWFFLKGGFRTGMPVSAVFTDPGVGQQLPIGGDVKIRGVLVGSIAGMTATAPGEVTLDLRITEKDVPADSIAEIRSKTVFGQKWVELIPPENASGDVLAEGSVIPDERTVEPLEFERAMQLGHDLISGISLDRLANVMRNLAEGFGGQEGDAIRAIEEGLVALEAVNSRSGELDEAFRQLGEFSQWLDENDTSLLSFLESVDQANRALVGAAPEFIASNASVPRFLDAFGTFQVKTERDLGKLIEDGADVLEIVAVRADSIKAIVRQLEAFTTIWNSGLKQPCAGEFESDLTCWQIYLSPGMDSRGLYADGEGPDEDEAGDPNERPLLAPLTDEELTRLLERFSRRDVDPNLARLLLGPSATLLETGAP